jgi:dihydroorotate dehydrogenase
VIVGGNIGKNKVTPNELALQDYVSCFRVLQDTVDYFVVNVSSPNTPGLRELQEKGPLLEILNALQTLNYDSKVPRPLLLKIAPDLMESQLDDIVEISLQARLSGVIATNTTISRTGLQAPAAKVEAIGAGGLSGAPLTQRSNEVLSYLRQKSGGKLSLVGVGGIMEPQDAVQRMSSGADLVQVYTGLIYAGPGLPGKIVTALRSRD